MASIKIDSKTVVGACEKWIIKLEKIKSELNESLDNEPPPHFYGRSLNPHKIDQINGCEKVIENTTKLKILAEYSPSGTIYITHEDFALIGDYLPKHTTYNIQGIRWTKKL